MKAQRLLAILNILLSGKKISARQLSQELEISERTVYRDVEALSEAGFPVYATTGRDGGFSIIEGFRLTGQLFSTSEIQRIISALHGLSGICPEHEIEALTRKFSLLLKESGLKGIPCPENRIFIELTPSRREKIMIDLLDKSISASSVITITYCDVNSTETIRDIEPLALVFYWQSWFVYAWCRLRSAFRCFRVSRIQKVVTIPLERTGPPADLYDHPWNREWDSDTFEELVFIAGNTARSMIFDFFDPDAVCEQNDGSLLVKARFPLGDWIVPWIMGLPGIVSIMEPAHLRRRIHERACEITKKNSPLQ